MTSRAMLGSFAFSSLAITGLMTGIMPAAADGTMSMTLVERATTDAVVDIGAKDDSAGDILTFANEIYDETNKTAVGSDNGWCIRTVPGKAWECFWTLSLADGQITGEGPFLDGKDSVLAVTGGTGKYKTVRGEMQLHASPVNYFQPIDGIE